MFTSRQIQIVRERAKLINSRRRRMYGLCSLEGKSWECAESVMKRRERNDIAAYSKTH
jgi:hypothetical protein